MNVNLLSQEEETFNVTFDEAPMGFRYSQDTLLIQKVVKSSRAEAGGVYPGCRITMANGQPASIDAIDELPFPITLTFIRSVCCLSASLK